MRLDGAAVQFHEVAHQGQADAETVPVGTRLAEHREDLAQHVRVDADAVVLHHDPRLRAAALGPQADAAVVVGELAGVVEQRGDHLGEPVPVAVHHQRLARQLDRDLPVRRVDRGAAEFDRAADRVDEVDPLAVQGHHAAVDA